MPNLCPSSPSSIDSVQTPPPPKVLHKDKSQRGFHSGEGASTEMEPSGETEDTMVQEPSRHQRKAKRTKGRKEREDEREACRTSDKRRRQEEEEEEENQEEEDDEEVKDGSEVPVRYARNAKAAKVKSIEAAELKGRTKRLKHNEEEEEIATNKGKELIDRGKKRIRNTSTALDLDSEDGVEEEEAEAEEKEEEEEDRTALAHNKLRNKGHSEEEEEEASYTSAVDAPDYTDPGAWT